MKKLLLLGIIALLAACSEEYADKQGDPKGTQYYTESFTDFPNPERGFHRGGIYMSEHTQVDYGSAIQVWRRQEGITLYQSSYYLTDFMEQDIPEWYLERFDHNMQALREGGAKVVLRFAYKQDMSDAAKPWDAAPEWVNRHIDQLAPYLRKNADVIFCMQAGFIGVWGEWCYTTGYPMAPRTDDEYAPRWEMLDRLLDALPSDRQICVRTPAFKLRYLQMHGLPTEPLSEADAYQPTARARIAAHNDCFVSSADDWGTYTSAEEREYWAADTRYTVMGGETCQECSYSSGERAIAEMERYHWTHLSNGWHPDIINSWRASGHLEEISRRLGYRFVLDKAWFTRHPHAGQPFEARLTLRNVGFAAPVNARDVELIFVSQEDSTKYVYRQDTDPRQWSPGQTSSPVLKCTLDEKMHGRYDVYLNLPDPYPTLHDNPDFSIRLANDAMWRSTTGYNHLYSIIL